MPEDYEFDLVLDVDIEVNNIKDWKIQYDKIEKKGEEIEEIMKPNSVRFLSYLQKGIWDPNYFFRDLIILQKFYNFQFRKREFYEKSFWWFVEISPEISDLEPKYPQRIEVLIRDKWTCRKCGRHCNSVHHIFSRVCCQEHAPELEWDIQNGVALCYECHKAITEDGIKWLKEIKIKSGNY